MGAIDHPARPVLRGLVIPGAPAGAGAELADNDLHPWFHYLDGLNKLQNSAFIAGDRIASESWPMNGLSYCTTAAGMWRVDAWLAAGSWLLQFPIDTRSDYPIVQYDVDNVNVGPTFDRYAATAGVGMHRVGPVTLARGWHAFTCKVVGKNAASSAWTLVYSGALFSRMA